MGKLKALVSPERTLIILATDINMLYVLFEQSVAASSYIEWYVLICQINSFVASAKHRHNVNLAHRMFLALMRVPFLPTE